MDKLSKSKIQDLLILSIFAIFTLGQLPGVFTQNVFTVPFRVHPLDVLSFLLFVFLLDETKIKLLKRMLGSIFAFLVFSLILSWANGFFDLRGLLYFARFAVYSSLFFVFPKKNYHKLLIAVGLIVVLYGWLQYLLLPDLVALKYVGWDDHFYRMVSTFLDPAFLGILLALFAILAVYLYTKHGKRLYLGQALIFIASLAFTYSRASYLALIAGLLVLLLRQHKILAGKLILFFFLVILLLPKNVGGEGVNLSRTNSLFQKIENYSQSISLASKSPVFGLGFNNICKAKEVYGLPSGGNSCSGLDNSLLFILATFGFVGTIILLKPSMKIVKTISQHPAGNLIASTGVAIGVHSLFTNTLFYPWVLVYFIVVANSIEESTGRNLS